MNIIEKLEDFNSIKTQYQFNDNDESILRIYDNKSNVSLQTIVVNHPISFLRNLQDFCNSVKIPVSDVDIKLIGFVSDSNGFIEIPDCPVISPYVYFKKAEEVDTSSTGN